MSQLLSKPEQFVHSAELVGSEATWAYLHSHKLREMNSLDQDYDQLYCTKATADKAGAGGPSSAINANGPNARKEPIERFALLIDTEQPKFEKQRQESIKTNVQAISATCEASISGLNAFYQRKVECLDSIRSSTQDARDRNIPRIFANEFDEDRHLDLALAPWPFLTMPGARSTQWPEGLPEFVERLDSLQPLALWNEPLDTLPYGVEFYAGAQKFLQSQLESLREALGAVGQQDALSESVEELSGNLGLGIRAMVGFAVLSANSDYLIESLAFLSKVESECPTQIAAIFQPIAPSLRKYLIQIQDQLLQRDNHRYLDTTKTSGVFSIAKFVSFAQQHEHNTSITTDGDYLYIFVAIPQKAMMYKIGTGATEATIPGKVYLEKKADRDGEVSWTYCQGRLFCRRVNEEFGVITLYDADTLNTIGDAKLLCGDIFSSSNCQQTNRYYPILTDGKSIYMITMKVVQKRRTVRPEMRKQYQQLQEDKKKTTAKFLEFEKALTKEGATKSERELAVQRKKELERKQLLEMQAREEELLRSKVAAQRGRESRRGRRGGYGDRVEYGRGRGARGPPGGGRGLTGEEPHDLKLNGGLKDGAANDPSSYKACQFYLHEFKTTEPESRNPVNNFVGERAEVITEIQQAFCGFFESDECDVAYKDHNLDAVEAAYQLACDAEEDRYKLTLPLSRSLLLCESLIVQDSAAGKKGNEGDVQVAEDSVLTPSCIHSGKWIMNGDNISYHQNVMQENTMIHVFSTNAGDEKPMTLLSRTKSTPLPAAIGLGPQPVLAPGKSLAPTASHLLAKEFQEHGLEGMPPNLDPSGLFDFKQPELQRDMKDREFFKQMILQGEDLDEFGDAPMDFFAREFRQLQREKSHEPDENSGDDEGEGDDLDEMDMFEEIGLQGTHRASLKNQEGLNPNYRGTITYDSKHRKYYVLVLANQQRYVAVVNDLHRFSQNFNDFISEEPEGESEQGLERLLEMIPPALSSSQEFLRCCLLLLERIEQERFNMPWRWNQWSNLYSHAVRYKHLRDQALMDQAQQNLQPLSQQLKKNESQADLGSPDLASKHAKHREKLQQQQRNKQLQKLQSRLEKVEHGERELLRREYAFEYVEAEAKSLNEILEDKREDPGRHQQPPGKHQPKGRGGKPKSSAKESQVESEAVQNQPLVEKPLESAAGLANSSATEVVQRNLRSIYERAKAAVQTGESGQQPSQEKDTVVFDGQALPFRRLDAEAKLLVPPSFLASYGGGKGAASEGHVLPVEHLLIHRELKKIHSFCQSGSVSALRNLFRMLEHADKLLESASPGKADGEARSVSTASSLKRAVLKQILIWATFADQLAGEHQKDRELLDSLLIYLLDSLRREGERKSEELRSLDDLCWKIIFVGWDYFCRTSLQQLDVLRLALEQSMQEAEDKDAKDQRGQPALPALAGEESGRSPEAASQSIYSVLLDTGVTAEQDSDRRAQTRVCPLELFYHRFFERHPSFYELEVLCKSAVSSYIVVLEPQVYQKALPRLQQAREQLSRPVAEAAEQGEEAERDSTEVPRSVDIVLEKHTLEPLHSLGTGNPFSHVFASYETVPISLAAVPTDFKSSTASLQFLGPAGFGHGAQAQKHGKKYKNKKAQEKIPEKRVAPSRGFLLEAVSRQYLSSSHDSLVYGGRLAVSSKLLSMPLGSALVADPLALEGLHALREVSSRDKKRRTAFDPRAVIKKYLNSAESVEVGHKPREEQLAELERARERHRQKSSELIESFVTAIQSSFAASPSLAQTTLQQTKAQRDKAAGRHLQVLIQTFVGLAQHAYSQRLKLQSDSDFDVVSRAQKLIQVLLKQELALLEQRKIEELRIIEIMPLINFVMQTLSKSILNDPVSVPFLGYKFLPGLVTTIALLKEAFKVHEWPKAQATEGSQTPQPGPNLLDCLQALTNEGIDFSREKVFETPHPYPQNDFSLSETIEVPKAIGFVVELDKRCSTENSSDQLLMYSGPDHIFQINPNFATQIKLSTKPNTRQPYLLLGSRMKIEFRSYSQRPRGRGGALPPGAEGTGQRTSAQNEARWGYRVIVRPIYSEPQNIVLSGPVRSAQRKLVYSQLGGEASCHRVEVMLNSLVCLASQFAKDMANVESFTPIRELHLDSREAALRTAAKKPLLSSVVSTQIQKLARHQLFKGGIANPQLLVSKASGAAAEMGKSQSLNYHDLIQQELKAQQDQLASDFRDFVQILQSTLPCEGKRKEEQAPEARKQSISPSPRGHTRDEVARAEQGFVPCTEQWSQKVTELLSVETVDDDARSASQSPGCNPDATATKRQHKIYKLVCSPVMDQVYAKIRELVPTPRVVTNTFLPPSARPYKGEWAALEKLLIVALLYQSQSLHLVQKIVDLNVPNLRSSGGVFQYGAGLKAGVLSDESFFLIDQLKLIGSQVNDLLMWLILRVSGEKETGHIVESVFEIAQEIIDARLEKKKADDEEEAKRQALEEEKQQQALEEERKHIQEAEEKLQKEVQRKAAEQEEKQAQESKKVEAQKDDKKPAGGKKGQASAAVLVTESKGRKMKRGKIVRRAIDNSKAKPAGKKGKEQNKAGGANRDKPPGDEPVASREEAKAAEKRSGDGSLEQMDAAKAKAEEQSAEDQPKYVGLSLGQINELKNQIEDKARTHIEEKYLGPGADPSSLKPLCMLYNLKYHSEDPTETVRQLFKKIKGRISKVIDLDDDSDPKLLAKIDDEEHSSAGLLRTSPFLEVCKDVRSRLLILLEIKPSIEYLNNVTKIDASRCFSRYGSIKFSQKGGLLRGPRQGKEGEDCSETGSNQQFPKLDEQDGEHDDELLDKMNMDFEEHEGEFLAPLPIGRSKSLQVGLSSSIKAKTQASQLKRLDSVKGGKRSGAQEREELFDEDSQGDWLAIHRKWKLWNKYHKQSGGAVEDKDLTSPFCSPLHSVLQFAKSSEIKDPSPIRQLLCEQQKRAAFRLFALKYQGRLYEILQSTPYQRFIWGNQSRSMGSSALDGVEACGETLVNKINERSKKLVKQLMSYTVLQAENMRHYQDILEKYLKQQDAKTSSGSQPPKASKQSEQAVSKKQSGSMSQGREGKGRGSPQSGSTADNSSHQGSQAAGSETSDRRIQKITFDDFIPWQMKTVMHSLNDLRVLLSDPFTQAYVLEALKEDQFKLVGQGLEKEMKNTAKERYPEVLRDGRDVDQPGLSDFPESTRQAQDQELGFQNIKQFLKALIQTMLQSNPASPLAEQFPNSSRLCQSAFRVAKIVLSQFVSDKQQIREAETSKILQEMMLEIIVSHLEKVCGLEQGLPLAPYSGKGSAEKSPEHPEERHETRPQATAVEETNLDEIVHLLKLLQETIRMSSDTQRAIAQHQLISQQAADAQGNRPALAGSPQQQFLSEGAPQVQRCARLLAYLMTEYEVPVVVRHSIRCARIFFFGLVDFHKLDLYESEDLKKVGAMIGTRQVGADDSRPAAKESNSESELKDCCKNKFVLASFKKIGQRISNTQSSSGLEALQEGEAKVEPQIEKLEASGKPEPTSLVEEDGKEDILERRDEPTRDQQKSASKVEQVLDETAGRKYVVYANINSQIEDFSFLVTALYHWEELYPAICPTQPSDPKPLLQKASKTSKMVAPEGKELRKYCAKGHSFLTLSEKPAYYGGGIICDACRKRISGEEFLHCKDCKEDYCSSCKFVPKKESEPVEKSKDKKKSEEPAKNEKKEEAQAPEEKKAQEGAAPKDDSEQKDPSDKVKGEAPDNKDEGKPPEEQEKAEGAKEKPVEAQADNKEAKAEDGERPEQSEAEAAQEKEKVPNKESEEVKEEKEQIASKEQKEGAEPEEKKEEKKDDKKEEGQEQPKGEEGPALAPKQGDAEPRQGQAPPVEEPKPKAAAEKPEAVGDEVNLKENFELFKQKKETQAKCEALQKDIERIEQNKDLLELLEQQHKLTYQTLIGDLIKKDGGLLSEATSQDSSIGKLLQEKKSKYLGLLGNSEAIKLLRESQSVLAKNSLQEKTLEKKSGKSQGPFAKTSAGHFRQNIPALVKGAIVGSGSQMSEVNLVPNRILLHGAHSQPSPHTINQKLSINALQTALVEILKHSHEVIYDDDTPEEQTRKLKSRNWNERVMHHLFQAMCIASQLQQRYSVPVTEPMEHEEALQFADLLERAYKEQIVAVPINPFLKEEFHHKKWGEGKKLLKDYFPFTLRQVKAGCKEPELPAGHAPPVVICPRSLVVSVTTEKFSKDIEKIIESRASNLKSLEKNPADGFRLNVCKNNSKRQGASVSNCILNLIQFLRQVLVGQHPAKDKPAGQSATLQSPSPQAFDDATSQRSSVTGQSERNQVNERLEQKQLSKFRQQQALRQEEIETIINNALRILKTKRWRDVQLEDKQIILGLFTVVGGWYGLTRIAAGSQVQAQVNGCWNEATVIDEGTGKRRVSVILNEDASLALVKVPHSKIKPQQTTMDKGINDRLNFDDLCEAVTFLHRQQAPTAGQGEAAREDPSGGTPHRVSLDEAMLSERVLFQMILKVCSQLNWNKIDHSSESFNQFRKILIEVTSTSSPAGGQSHEDKSEDYLEKQLIESWERIIDRNETKNLEFYTPREAARTVDCLTHLDSGNKELQTQSEHVASGAGDEGLLEILGSAGSPYVDTDYAQPVSSYLHGLPEPTVKKNQKEAALKLLFYWEKQVLPTTREFVRSTFQKWEMNYYFEQIRHHLRQGDQRAAIADAMVLWEQKIPNGVNLPSENIDWTAKVADECLVDSWALAKISYSRSASHSGGQSSSKTAHSFSPETSLPLILRLQNLGVQAIVIQIKLVDARYNVVLGEFYDGENSCSHFIWFPISHLYDLDYPLPPRPAGYLRKSLTQNYLQSISNINSLYARKTLIQFFTSRQSKAEDPLTVSALKSQSKENRNTEWTDKSQNGELKLHELISWSVQAEFSASPFNGWLRDLNCAIPIRSGGPQGSVHSSNQALSKSSKPEQESVQSLIEETSDRIIIERLLQREGKGQAKNQTKDGQDQGAGTDGHQVSQGGEQATSNPLGLIKDLLRNAASTLSKNEERENGNEAQKAARQALCELAEWTATNWHLMSEHVGTSRAVCDLCKQGRGEGRSSLSSDNQLIALHSVISQSQAGQVGAGSSQSIATLLMFPKAGCNLTPCSKIQFYSDPNQVNLVGEITAGAEARTTLPPLLLNHGQIWAKVLPGSLALLRREQQLEAQSSLPCALFQIPRQWGVVCWLTETLSTCLLEGGQSSIGLAKDVYSKLIGALDSFYQNSASPQMLKSQVLRLLTRLIRKLRYILRKESQGGPKDKKGTLRVTKEAHLEKTYVSEAFIKVILDDMDTAKRAEESGAAPSEPGETQLLCSAFLQDSVEFLMTLVVPHDAHAELDSWQDLLAVQQTHLSSLRDWLDPLMKTSLFMHFFNDEVESLPRDLLREIHDQTQFSRHKGLDHLLLIDRVPVDEALYPRTWLVDQIISMCKKHHARILDPLRDIYFERDEYEETEATGADGEKKTTKKSCYKIAVIVDGWDHLKPLPDYNEYFEQQGRAFEGFDQIASEDYRQFISLEDSDTEEEEDPAVAAAKEAAKKEEEERRKKEEAEMTPTEWACPACTFVNAIATAVCEICGGGRRPPMAELVAAFKKQKEEEAAALNPGAQAEKKEDSKEEEAGKGKLSHESLLRLKFLALDLSKIIKKEQKRVLEKEKAARLEILRLEKIREREKKVEELVLKHCFLKKGFKVWQITTQNKQPEEVAEGAAKDKKAENKRPSEEKKHQDSDAEKSEEDEEAEKDWQDQESGHGTSSGSEHKDSARGDVEAAAESEAEHADPRLKKLAELGYDLSLLEAEPQLAAAILASAGEQEERLAEEQRAQKEAEEAEKKKAEEEKARLQKEKEQEELKKKGLATEKVVYHTLKVLYGVEEILEDSNAVRALFKFLQQRLQAAETGEPTDKCSQILRSIHSTMQDARLEDIIMPEQPFEEQLAEYGLSKEQIQGMDAEEFVQTCSVLMAADVILLFRFFASQGYDFWLQKQAHSSFRVPNKGHQFNASLFEKLKSFVEVSFCQEKKVVQQLEPYQLRLLSKLEQEKPERETTEEEKAESVAKEEQNAVQEAQDAQQVEASQNDKHELKHDPKVPVGFFDDSGIAMNAAAQGQLHWLNQVTQADLSYNWALIKTFSKYFATTVPFINCSTSIADTPAVGAIPIALSAYTSSLRNLCLSNTKSELKHLILKNTSVEREKVPVLRFERLRLHENDNAAEPQARDRREGEAGGRAEQANGRREAAAAEQARQQPEPNHPTNFLFTQAYEQVKDIDPGALRPPQPRGADPHLSFEVYFAGEDVAGMGGPYRQFFSDISQELQMVAQKVGDEEAEDREETHPDGLHGQDGGATGLKPESLGLLCPSGCMLAKAERGKDNFALNPSKVSSRDLSLYIFLGVLMGVCVRTNTNLAVNLPTFVWKLLVGQRLAADDIMEFDEGIITELNALLRASKEDFELQFEDRFFITRLSDQSVVSLGDGGATKALTYENRVDYVRKVLHTRMTECEAQVEAIKRGMCQVIPAALLNMVGHSELAEWVYGKRTIDIDLLRRHTDSSAFSAEDELISWFWEVLEEMSQEDRRKFIQFCYAQATIPANDAEFVRQQVRFLIKPSAAQRDEPAELRDKRLPKADTCFFNFMLPRYSTKQAMKEKILFAITFDNVGLNAEQEAGGGPGRIDDAASHRSGASRDSY